MTCSRCGNPVQSEDKFCGSCGAVVLPPAPQAEKVVPEPSLKTPSTPYAPRRRNRFWVNAAAIFLLLLISAGAVAALALNSGTGLLGSSTQQEGTQDPEAASASPSSTPDPAFALPLQALEPKTQVPIMLPAKLPNELKNVAVDADLEGDRYGILFKSTPPDDLVESFVRYNTVATLNVVPQSESEPSQLFEATSTESLRLADGTGAQLRYMEPLREGGNYGPYWEGTFDRDGYTYTLSTFLGQNGKEISEQALSTMVLARGPRGEVAASPEPNPDEEALEEFGREYDAANRGGDWEKTYSMLDESVQEEFTEEEWVEKQQALQEVNGTPAPLESVTVQLEETMSDAPGTVTLNYGDGTQNDLTVTTFRAVDDPNDDGGPRLILSDVAISYMKGVPVDGATDQVDTANPQREIFRSEAETAAGDYYRAAGSQDWDYTYDALDSETQALFTREEWSEKNQWFFDNAPAIYHIESANLDETAQEPLAEVVVRLTGEDGSSSIRNTYFVNENGEWKHRFSQEEIDLFGPGVPYEEWVNQ